ncbi:MAG: hypothetical protein V3V94_04310 [Candidatus Brocadiales bacterium]|jgi:hypothetical protein
MSQGLQAVIAAIGLTLAIGIFFAIQIFARRFFVRDRIRDPGVRRALEEQEKKRRQPRRRLRLKKKAR